MSPPPEASQWVREWVQQNQYVHTSGPKAPWITTEDHVAGWTWTKERTASGQSRLTPAQLKAGAEDPTLADLGAGLANFPYFTGYSPTRWRCVFHVLFVGQDFFRP